MRRIVFLFNSKISQKLQKSRNSNAEFYITMCKKPEIDLISEQDYYRDGHTFSLSKRDRNVIIAEKRRGNADAELFGAI